MAEWLVRLICCGRDDGVERFDTWDAANRFRESYTNKIGVAEHGYSAGLDEPGHQRAGIISLTSEPGAGDE